MTVDIDRSVQAISDNFCTLHVNLHLGGSSIHSVENNMANDRILVDHHTPPKRISITMTDILNPPNESEGNSARSSPSSSQVTLRRASTSSSQSSVRDVRGQTNRFHPYQKLSPSPSVIHTSESGSEHSSPNVGPDEDEENDRARDPSRTERRRSDRQEYRRPYAEEQLHFIWFHQHDLGLTWVQVEELYNQQWPEENRTHSGMECVLYRLISKYNFPSKRKQKKISKDPLYFGMWKTTGIRYNWMKSYADRLPGRREPRRHL